MNIYIGVLSLILCTFNGYRLSVKFNERKKFFSDFFSFNQKMISEVSFTQNPLLKIVESEQGDKRDFIKFISGEINKAEYYVPDYLKKEEIPIVKEYANNLGRSDRETQLKFLSSQTKIIENLCASSEKDEIKYKKLYVKLGFLFGLIILIALL